MAGKTDQAKHDKAIELHKQLLKRPHHLSSRPEQSKAYPGNKKPSEGAIAFEPRARGSECGLNKTRKRAKKRGEPASQQFTLINPQKGNTMQTVNTLAMPMDIDQKDAAKTTSKKPARSAPRRKRRGLGMTDSGFVVLLAVFALVGVTTLFLTVRGNVRDNNAAQLFTQMIGNVEASFANTTSYPSGSLIALLDAGGYVPNSARVVASDGTVSMVSPYGSAVTVTGSGGADYSIAFAALSNSACVKLLENSVGFSTNPVKGVTLGSTAQSLPLTKATIAAGCTGGSTDVTVTY